MANLGDRILTALRTITTDPALVAQVEANKESDASQTALLDTLGSQTTELSTQITALRNSLDDNESLDETQAAQLDAIQATIDSLNEAFPEPTEG